MHLTEVQDQAIQARMALVVGAKKFDRLFAGVRFDEVDGDILFVYAKNEMRGANGGQFCAPHFSHRDGYIGARYQYRDGSTETAGALVLRRRRRAQGVFGNCPQLID
jgi:hypothetical protein